MFDIETLVDPKEACKSKHWFSVSNYPGQSRKATVNSIICIGYKFLGEKKTYCLSAWDHKSRWKKNCNDDYAILKEFRKILEDCVSCVTHNGKKFDYKFLQSRFKRNNIPVLPRGYLKHLDTYQICKSNFYEYSNALGNLAEAFKLPQLKMQTGGAKLWDEVGARNVAACNKMTRYCKQDVKTTEALFEEVRLLTIGIPNHNLFRADNQRGCHACPSMKIKKNGFHYGPKYKYQRYVCKDCGSSTQDPKALK